MASNPFQPPEHSGPAQYVYRPLRVLTAVIATAFVLDVVCLVVVAAAQAMLLEHDPGVFVGEEPRDDRSIALGLGLGLGGLLYFISYVAGGIFFLVWLVRASKNARALGSQGMEFTPGWTAGWFFVPFLNLFRPYQAVSELYQASEPEAGPYDWASFEPPSLVLAWWMSWIGFSVVGTAAQNFWSLPYLTAALAAFSAVMAMRVLLAIQRRLEEKKSRVGRIPPPGEVPLPPTNRLL